MSPAPYKAYLDAAAAGTGPFAYLKASDGTLIDAAVHGLASSDVPMRVPDDFPLGTYTVTGTFHDAAGNNTTVTFKLIVTGSLLASDDFNGGTLSSQWTQDAGTWVQTGGELTVTDATDAHWNYIHRNDVSGVGDMLVEAKCYQASSSADTYEGVCARYDYNSGSPNYYMAWMNPDGGIQVWKCVNGSLAQIGSKYTGTWNWGDTLGLKVTGTGSSTRLTVYRNGSALTVLTDLDPSVSAGTLDSGSAALNCYSDAPTSRTFSFDDFKVSSS